MKEEEREPIDRNIPLKGDNAEELLDFINIESALDEFLRTKRDLERDIMLCKNRIMDMANIIAQEAELMNDYVEELQAVYKKYIDDGCPKEDNVH